MKRFFAIHVPWLALLLSLYTTHASAAATNSFCALDAQSFAALQKMNSNAPDSIQIELQTRKELLQKVLACLQNEAEAARENITSVSTADSNMQVIQNNLIAALDNADRFYANEKNTVPDAGLYSAKEIAATTREWRANTFLPELERIDMFVTWANNESFLTTAKNRLQDLNRSVQILQLVEYSDDIQALLSKAGRSYSSARSFEDQARAAFINGTDPSSPLKLSLEALANTYNSFLDLSNTITTLLPRGKK